MFTGTPSPPQTAATLSIWAARALVAGSSAAVLVLEILAGRLVAPYVGVSLETFTAIIGIVLAGVAVGAWGGGWLADRIDPRLLLGPVFSLSGILCLIVPMVIDSVGPLMQSGRPVQIVILTGASLLLPAITLSTIPPIVTKLRLQSLAETGTVVGSLSAVSTAGALLATVLTGFVFVAAFPTRPVVLVLGGVLLATGLLLLALSSRRAKAVGLALVILVTGSLSTVPGPCQFHTAYFCAVVQLDPVRSTGRLLLLDSLPHSYVDLGDPRYLGLGYARTIADALMMRPDGPIDAVYVGGGGFTLPRYVGAIRPGSRATVLEIDRPLVGLVQRELGVSPSDASVIVGDARLEIRQRPPQSADLVVGDAFGGLSVPWHLTTREFVQDVRRILRSDGVYMINVIDYPPLAFVRSEAATLRETFSHVAVVATGPKLLGLQGGNFILVGSDAPLAWARIETLLADRDEIAWFDDPQIDEFIGGSVVLRDDYAPVDQLLGRPQRQ